MKKILNSFVLSFIAVFLIFTSCSDDNEDISVETNTIVDIASGDNQFSTLVAALQKADLVSVLQGSGPFTVFAPTNDAFGALLVDLGVSSLDDLSKEALTPILLYHVLGGSIKSTDLSEGYFSTSSTGPDGNFIDVYVNLDSGVSLNGRSKVTSADIEADNGVIHIIDQVLTPPTVVDIAIANTSFTSLVSAVVKADLVSALSGVGPFTVFAPTDNAFADLLTALGVASVDEIPLETLTDVLLYHVVNGNVRSNQLSNGMVPTLNSSKDVEINIDNGVKLNTDVNVVLADVQASNGVVHVIDKVLIP